MVEQELQTPCAYVPRVCGFRPFVYGLVDPAEPRHIRYVGMAMKANRPYEHSRNARKETKHSHLFHWIRLLQAEGREPEVLILEELCEGASRNFVGEIERLYISSLRGIDHRLTNVSKGGWGGHAWPEDGRCSEVTKAKMSAAHKGVKQWWAGERHGDAKLTEKKVLAIRADSRSKSEIARSYGVSVPTIINIKARIKWAHVEGPESVPSRNGRLTPWNKKKDGC